MSSFTPRLFFGGKIAHPAVTVQKAVDKFLLSLVKIVPHLSKIKFDGDLFYQRGGHALIPEQRRIAGVAIRSFQYHYSIYKELLEETEYNPFEDSHYFYLKTIAATTFLSYIALKPGLVSHFTPYPNGHYYFNPIGSEIPLWIWDIIAGAVYCDNKLEVYYHPFKSIEFPFEG